MTSNRFRLTVRTGAIAAVATFTIFGPVGISTATPQHGDSDCSSYSAPECGQDTGTPDDHSQQGGHEHDSDGGNQGGSDSTATSTETTTVTETNNSQENVGNTTDSGNTTTIDKSKTDINNSVNTTNVDIDKSKTETNTSTDNHQENVGNTANSGNVTTNSGNTSTTVDIDKSKTVDSNNTTIDSNNTTIDKSKTEVNIDKSVTDSNNTTTIDDHSVTIAPVINVKVGDTVINQTTVNQVNNAPTSTVIVNGSTQTLVTVQGPNNQFFTGYYPNGDRNTFVYYSAYDRSVTTLQQVRNNAPTHPVRAGEVIGGFDPSAQPEVTTTAMETSMPDYKQLAWVAVLFGVILIAFGPKFLRKLRHG